MDNKDNRKERSKMHKTLDSMQEGLSDLENVIQLLEMSLLSNEDDMHVVRSVRLIGKMVLALSEKCNTLLNMDSDCGSSQQ